MGALDDDGDDGIFSMRAGQLPVSATRLTKSIHPEARVSTSRVCVAVKLILMTDSLCCTSLFVSDYCRLFRLCNNVNMEQY